MSFADFKKKQSSISESIDKLKNLSKASYADERIWNIVKDAAGNGLATIRFLPQKDLSIPPIVLLNRHSFQAAGKWFIEDCPVTIGEACPVCEYSASIWKSNEDLARSYWRKKTYISNILVIEDIANPENNGKVFIFKFGKKIYDKIMEVVAPEDEDETAVNIFDFDEGINFKLKLTQVNKFNNYDKSKFMSATTSIGDGDEKIQEAIYNQIYDLSEFTDPKKFKSYDEILKKFKNTTSTPSLNKNYSEKVEEKSEEKEDEEYDFDSLLNDDDIPF